MSENSHNNTFTKYLYIPQVPRGEGEAIAGKFKSAFAEVSAAESSENIIPVFLHLIHRVNVENSNSVRTRNPECTVHQPDQSAVIGRSSVSPTTMRKLNNFRDGEDWDNTGSHRASPTPGTVSFQRHNSLMHCGERIKSHIERNYRSSLNKHKDESMFSQRCRSYDEALNLCKMEVFPSNFALDQSKFTRPESKLKNRYSSTRKISKPLQMPTGKSKNRKGKCTSSLKLSDNKLNKHDSFQGQKKSENSTHLMLAASNSRINELRSSKRLRKYGEFLSKSVDQNLQKCESDVLKLDKQNILVEKPLTLLQRGRSFIQETKDKHWKEKRLSFRNLSSRNDISQIPNYSMPVMPNQNPGRTRALPTEGKTWVSRSEGDEVDLPLEDSLSMSFSASDRLGETTSSPPNAPSLTINEYNTEYTQPFQERRRKFSVFSKTIGNFLSRGSMPDIPRATAHIYDKFDSLKKSIKKRSV